MHYKLCIICILMIVSSVSAQRQETLLLDGWRFCLGDAKGAEARDYDDTRWRTVSIPHDWAITGEFDVNNDLQTMLNVQNGETKANLKTGRTGGLPHIGTGWYRRTFEASTCGRTFIYFDGAMSHARVFINGKEVAFEPNGYSAFTVDATSLVVDGENSLAVRLDNPEHSSRWYPGAGIFRPVTLISTGEAHIPTWGTKVTTPYVKRDYAIVSASTTVKGATKDSVLVTTDILDAADKIIASYTQRYKSKDSILVTHNMTVTNPDLWSPDNPSLYTLQTRVYDGNKLSDATSTVFGIRTIEYIPDHGFFLNGIHEKIRGVCIHHDLGALGAAIDKDVIRMRLNMLKDMGCNAVRTSHNLPSSTLVRLCDEMGLMLLIEPFDEWDTPKSKNGFHRFFNDYADNQVRQMVRHFRNSPSVIMWGIGNEVPNQRDDEGYRIVARLQNIVHEEDPTRSVTVCMDQIPYVVKNGFAADVDIPGINYNTWNYDKARAVWNQNMILGSETASTVSSRGVYKFPVSLKAMAMYTDHQSSGYDTEFCSWSNVPDVDFALNDDNEWYLGQFVWTGFDYLGEPTPYNNDSWPSHSSVFGIIDLANLPKDRYYLYRSVWNTTEHTLHILPHWTWKGREGEVTPVMVYTDYPEAELFVNGKSQGRQHKWTANEVASSTDSLALLHRYRLLWDKVEYEPGEIMVIAYDSEGKEAERKSIRTAGAACNINLVRTMSANTSQASPLCMFTVSITDTEGNLCPDAANEVTVTVTGGARFVAMANGDPTCLTPFSSNKMKVFHGQLTFYIEQTSSAPAVVKVKSAGLKTAEMKITE